MSEAWADAPAIKSREVLGPMDEPAERYKKALEASTRQELVEELLRWPVLAADALAAVQADEFDWDEFQHAMAMERKGKWCGEELTRRYGAILVPAAFIEPAMVAGKFHVPFGLSYLRLWEMKRMAQRKEKR